MSKEQLEEYAEMRTNGHLHDMKIIYNLIYKNYVVVDFRKWYLTFVAKNLAEDILSDAD